MSREGAGIDFGSALNLLPSQMQFALEDTLTVLHLFAPSADTVDIGGPQRECL